MKTNSLTELLSLQRIGEKPQVDKTKFYLVEVNLSQTCESNICQWKKLVTLSGKWMFAGTQS